MSERSIVLDDRDIELLTRILYLVAAGCDDEQAAIRERDLRRLALFWLKAEADRLRNRLAPPVRASVTGVTALTVPLTRPEPPRRPDAPQDAREAGQ